MERTPRRLFLLFDGSGDVAAATKDFVSTNITRLNRALTYGFEEKSQIIHYFSGVGTHGDDFSQKTGRGLDQIVIDGYVAMLPWRQILIRVTRSMSSDIQEELLLLEFYVNWFQT